MDGHNLKDINITSLRSQISCVLQEPFLYAKSIKDNININEDVSLDIIHDRFTMISWNLIMVMIP